MKNQLNFSLSWIYQFRCVVLVFVICCVSIPRIAWTSFGDSFVGVDAKSVALLGSGIANPSSAAASIFYNPATMVDTVNSFEISAMLFFNDLRVSPTIMNSIINDKIQLIGAGSIAVVYNVKKLFNLGLLFSIPKNRRSIFEVRYVSKLTDLKYQWVWAEYRLTPAVSIDILSMLHFGISIPVSLFEFKSFLSSENKKLIGFGAKAGVAIDIGLFSMGSYFYYPIYNPEYSVKVSTVSNVVDSVFDGISTLFPIINIVRPLSKIASRLASFNVKQKLGNPMEFGAGMSLFFFNGGLVIFTDYKFQMFKDLNASYYNAHALQVIPSKKFVHSAHLALDIHPIEFLSFQLGYNFVSSYTDFPVPNHYIGAGMTYHMMDDKLQFSFGTALGFIQKTNYRIQLTEIPFTSKGIEIQFKTSHYHIYAVFTVSYNF